MQKKAALQTKAGSDLRIKLAGLVLIGGLLLAVVAWGILDLRRAAWSQAATTSSNLVTVLQRDIGRLVETYDLSLQATLLALKSPMLGSLDPASRQSMLFDGALGADSIGDEIVLDADGRMLYSSNSAPLPSIRVDDRAYFYNHRDDPNLGLYVSLPYRSRVSGRWTLALSRRVDGPDGRFAGVVVGMVRFEYFERLFSALDIGPRGSISLLRSDGRMIYRTPFRDGDVGRDVSGSSVFANQRNAASGVFESVSEADGRARLFAFARIGRLPLLLSVNMGLGSIYAPWRLRAVVTGVTSLLLLATGGWLLATLRSQTRRLAEAEQASAQAAALFAACFDSAADALFLVDVDRDDRLTYRQLNPACERLVELTGAICRGRAPSELFDPEIAVLLERHYRTCARRGETCTYAVTRTLSTGLREWQTALSPIRDADGRVSLILGSARDMTAHNQGEADRLQAAKMEAVGRLTAGVAHDFNNHLQTIISSLEILSADFLHGPDAQDVADAAHAAATNGAMVTHRLLAFSRQQVLRPCRVNATALMNETRALLGKALFGPTLHVKLAVEPFTDDILVDPAQAETCLLNLLLNAGEAMPDGGNLVLHARNARPGDALFGSLAPGRHVIIAVHDSGRGMDEATRTRAFEPFFTTKAFGTGAGLGLSMAQGFCRQSGGDIRLLSGGAVGTRVELWLPAAPVDLLAGDEAQFNLATIGRGTGRLLLVEDEPDVAAALSATLVSGGFEVVTVSSAADGLLRLQDRDPYDALLTDYSMPDMSGVEFLRHAAAVAPGLPTLMLTGYDVDSLALAALTRPVCLLRKPIRRTALLNAVREVVGEREAAGAR